MKIDRPILLSKPSVEIIILVTIALLCISFFADAASYYFSTSSGDDSRSAVQAQSSITPWKTINKLNSVLHSLEPGDSVLFKRGEVFYGAIAVTKSGTSGSPIVFSAYGAGSKPVISSLAKLSEWVPLGSGIWESNIQGQNREVNIVLLNGVMQEMGRYPNSNDNNGGYLIIDDFNSNLSVTDKELAASPDWTGAEIVIRKNRWSIDRNQIESHAGSTINYIPSSHYKAKIGFGYFIQHHIKTLDRLGEWYYDPQTSKMYIYFGDENPALNNIEISTFDNLVYASGCSNLVFSDLTFKGGNTDSFRIKNGGGIAVINCEIIFSGENGLKVSKHAGFKIENTSILCSNSTGINLRGSSSYPLIKNNRIENTGLFPGMGRAVVSNGTAIQCYSKGALIEGNTVFNSGYNGIAIKLNQSTTKNNFISNFCLVKDDGGGIYNQNGSNQVMDGSVIAGNIIMNGIGAIQGTDGAVSSAEGIYMDDNSNGVEIRDNTVSKCRSGIYFHNARNIELSGNTFFDNVLQFYAKHDKNGDPIRDITVRNNIFFSKLPVQMVSHVETRLNDLSSIGSFDQNYYARPFDDGVIFYTSYKETSDNKVIKLLDLDGWRSEFKKDANSKKSPVSINPYTVNLITGSNKFPGGAFTAEDIEMFGNNCTMKRADEGLLDGGYLEVRPTDNGSSITMSVGALDINKKYLLRYSVRGEGSMSIGSFLRYGGSPYKPITPLIYRRVSALRNDYEIMFSPSVSQQSGTLVFTVDQDQKYYLDNIELFEADVTETNPDDFILFEYNSTAETKKVLLKGNYVDVKNNKYSNAVVLAPFSSVILLKLTEDRGYSARRLDKLSNETDPGTDSENFSLYPNPANNTLYITCSASLKNTTAQLSIMSVAGKIVLQAPVNISDTSSASINISQLHKGSYIAKLEGGNRVYSEKFIKE